MHIYMSPQTILPNLNEIHQAVSEELRSQDSDDGRNDGRNDGQPSQKHYTLSNFVAWGIKM